MKTSPSLYSYSQNLVKEKYDFDITLSGQNAVMRNVTFFCYMWVVV
jgi:hypothetical protein